MSIDALELGGDAGSLEKLNCVMLLACVTFASSDDTKTALVSCRITVSYIQSYQTWLDYYAIPGKSYNTKSF